VAQVIRAGPCGQTVVVNQSGDSLAEAVGGDLRDAELLADVAPLLAEVIRVSQRARRGRENYCALAHVRQAASDSIYVAMTRGRQSNSAYIYERATEAESGLDPLPGAHVTDRGTAQHAGRLARAIIAHHDQPITAHEVAAQTPSAALPRRVRRIHDRRAATVQRRRATYRTWQADTKSAARAMTAQERYNSRSRNQSGDYGIEM
jgi:hypothetical protein